MFILCWCVHVQAQPAAEAPTNAVEKHIAWLWDADIPPKNSQHLAIVTEHILLTDARLLHRARLSSLNVTPSTLVTPVVHVEFDILRPPPVPNKYHDDILNAVLSAARQSNSGWVQLDYEARPSHKVFYKSLVHDIKMALPAKVKLSVTALAWWCRSNNWLDDLDADEVVPMFFRMGKVSLQMNELLINHPEKLHARCRSTAENSAIGFAVQESNAVEVAAKYNQVYWFNYTRWNERSAWPPMIRK